MKTKEKALGVTAMTRQGEKKGEAALSSNLLTIRGRLSNPLETRPTPPLPAFNRKGVSQ